MNPQPTISNPHYRGRIAPSPTGLLHLGHARTFWTAQQRACAQGGTLLLRDEDLDRDRCKPEFVQAMFEDLRWFGFHWAEGPDCDGPFAPYKQSERMPLYRATLEKLIDLGAVYRCTCSRKDIQSALTAPHAADDETIYPGTCRAKADAWRATREEKAASAKLAPPAARHSPRFSWRFRVPDGETVSFVDEHIGPQQFVAGRDFGDFVVWRHDDIPAYQLACVTDDDAMRITEVVRGADLLVSTARQLLLYRTLKIRPPRFFHCPLLTNAHGIRLAKRHDALSLRKLRELGRNPEELRASLAGNASVSPIPS